MTTVYECNNIPKQYSEIPTPKVARHFPHLAKIANHIPEYEQSIKISLLIGRDIIEAHHVHEQIIGPRGAPFAQKLSLGWVIVGDVCLGKVHQPSTTIMRVNTFKTFVVDGNRSSIFEPCKSNLMLKETAKQDNGYDDSKLFIKTKDDDKVGSSVEDRVYLDIMTQEVTKSEDDHWMAPLPFRKPQPRLPLTRDMKRSCKDNILQHSWRKLSVAELQKLHPHHQMMYGTCHSLAFITRVNLERLGTYSIRLQHVVECL